MPTKSLHEPVIAVENKPLSPAFPADAAADLNVTRVLELLDRELAAPAAPVDGPGLECAVEDIPESRQVPVRTAACPVCLGRKAVPRFALPDHDFRLVTCTGCGVGQLHPQPDAATLRSFYPPSYYGVTGAKFVPLVESLVRMVAARQARAVMRGYGPGSRVLDVGCGRGVLLGALADMGHETHGFEISETAAEGADPRARIRVAPRLSETQYRGRSFDAVILWHVLEHLPDPRETLLEVRRIMRTGGRLAVAVPNFSSLQARWAGSAWFHLDLPRHLYHFPVRALSQLMTECGFECTSEHHFSLRQNPFGWVQSALNRCDQMPRNGLYTLLKRRNGAGSHAFDARTRRLLRCAYYAGMPLALAASALESLCRSGATVCVMAQAR